ncbi:MAG: GAF domain-containing protein [Rhabdochlamydiaceae bacterium]|nr:GAF domain-containing protein [Rhabdochlamydiaceae bacterium]
MFEHKKYNGTQEQNYALLQMQLVALLEGKNNLITDLANAAALLNQFLPAINWVGFYLYHEGDLILGPFQGLPACTRIPLGKGVCGAAALAKQTLYVEDVSRYPDHIACDAATKSELVIPLIKNNALIAVLDIDSPITHRFDPFEIEQLENYVRQLISSL